MNINTQMNYWPVETCDLPECHMPLLEMLKDLAKKGNHFGLRGWASWHNSDLWRFNYEATKNPIWGFWQMGGFWSARHIWEHYLHTRDQAFLREYYDRGGRLPGGLDGGGWGGISDHEPVYIPGKRIYLERQQMRGV